MWLEPDAATPPDAAGRLLGLLPSIYRAGADTDLARLLQAFEDLLFAGWQGNAALPGIERLLQQLPAVFAPLGLEADGHGAHTPGRFLPWLATWLAFAPHALVEPARLRHVVAGIVPLYGLRGTPAYLVALLKLCFDEIAAVQVDDGAIGGVRLGTAVLGVDSILGEERPFWFRVDVALAAPLHGGPPAAARFEQRLRAVIDFAKPAHTAYVLNLRQRE